MFGSSTSNTVSSKKIHLVDALVGLKEFFDALYNASAYYR
jgi:hypothetical protein